MFGDLLQSFSDEGAVAEAVLKIGDLNLLAALRKRAAEEGMAIGAFATLAVRRYAEDASDEEWITLMGALGRSPDPGLAFMSRALTLATQSAN